MEAIRTEHDISAAVVASAILEAKLEELIQQKLINKRPALKNELFSNQGPLSTFHGKIVVGEAFGIITSPMAGDLKIIKNIRNVFAHAKQQLDFDHPDIAAQIAEVNILSAMKRSRPSSGRELTFSNKIAFLLAIQIFLIVLENIASYAGIADRALAAALADDNDT